MSENNEPLLEEPPVAGNEIDTLVGSLERQRRTLAWKCAGLDAAGLRTTAAASKISLGGLLKHLALVEDDVLSQKLLGRELGPVGHGGLGRRSRLGVVLGRRGHPEQLMALWQDTAARSRANVRQALAEGGVGHLAAFTNSRGSHPVSGVC